MGRDVGTCLDGRALSGRLTVHMAAGESIWTESCYKFTRASTEAMLQDAGMGLERWYTDDDGSYALALAAPG